MRDFKDKTDLNGASEESSAEKEKDLIFGRNSVAEALKSDRPLDCIMVAKGEHGGSVPKLPEKKKGFMEKLREKAMAAQK